jgi:hypothetical protein
MSAVPLSGAERHSGISASSTNHTNQHHRTRINDNSPMIKAELLQEYRKLAAEAADLRRFL